MRQMLLLTNEDVENLRRGETLRLQVPGGSGEILLGFYTSPPKGRPNQKGANRETVRYCKRCHIPKKFSGPADQVRREYNRHYAAYHSKKSRRVEPAGAHGAVPAVAES